MRGVFVSAGQGPATPGEEQQAADLQLSLRVIAQAMLDGQADLSEGSLRHAAEQLLVVVRVQ